MKSFLRSKLVLSLAAFLMIAAAIVVPLSGNFIRAHAQGTFALSLTKTAPSTVARGGTIPYTLTLTNTGTEEIFDLHITDPLPSQLTSITTPVLTLGSGHGDCLATAFPTVSCTVDNFLPNTTDTITFSATVNPSLTSGTITNTATAQSHDLSSPVTATSVTTISPTTPPPPIIKHIPINGPISSIKNTVNKVLKNLGVRLAVSCTVGLLANKVTLISLSKIDFTLAQQPELLDKEISIAEALLELVPGFGCAEAIVNLLSGGGIDELHACLHDTGCRHEIATDPTLKRDLCIAVVFALEGVFPVSLFPFLTFESNFLC